MRCNPRIYIKTMGKRNAFYVGPAKVNECKPGSIRSDQRAPHKESLPESTCNTKESH